MFTFSPENRDINPIQGVRNTPNSIIPTGLERVNINPVNISPFFQGEQSRRASIATDLAVQNQALREQEFAFTQKKFNTEVALKVLNNLDGDVRRSAGLNGKVTQNNVLNSGTGLDVESTQQAALHTKYNKIFEDAQTANSNLLSGVDFDGGLDPSAIVNLSQEYEKNIRNARSEYEKDPEVQKFLRLNAMGLKFDNLMEKTPHAFDYAKASDLKQRINFHRGIPGNYSEEVLNSPPPSNEELNAALQKVDYGGLLETMEEDFSKAFAARTNATVTELAKGQPGGEDLLQITEESIRVSGPQTFTDGMKLVNSPQYEPLWESLTRTGYPAAKQANPLLTREQYKQSLKEDRVREQLRINQIDFNAKVKEQITNNKIKLETRRVANPTGGSSGSGSRANTEGERDFNRVQTELNAKGHQLDGSQTNVSELIIRAGGVGAVNFEDLGNGTSQVTIPIFKNNGEPELTEDLEPRTRSFIVKNVPKNSTNTSTASSTTRRTNVTSSITTDDTATSTNGFNPSTFRHSLTVQNESGFDPAIESGIVNAKGEREPSFGLYQFNVKSGEAAKFIDFAVKNDTNITKPKSSKSVEDVRKWFQDNASRDKIGFAKLQEKYETETKEPKLEKTFNDTSKPSGLEFDDQIVDMFMSIGNQFGQGGLKTILGSSDVKNATTREEYIDAVTNSAINRFNSQDIHTQSTKDGVTKRYQESAEIWKSRQTNSIANVKPAQEFSDLGNTGFQFKFLGDGKIHLKNELGQSEISIEDYNLKVQNGELDGPRLDQATGKPFPVGAGTAINTGTKPKKAATPRTIEIVNKEIEEAKSTGVDEFGRPLKTDSQIKSRIEKLEKEKKSLERSAILKKGRELKVERATAFLDNASGKDVQFKFDGFGGVTGRARVKITVTKSTKDPNKFLVKEGAKEVGVLTKAEIIKKYIK